MLIDGSARLIGFARIVSHLRNRPTGSYDLDSSLSHEQDVEKTCDTSQNIVEANLALVLAVADSENSSRDGKGMNEADRDLRCDQIERLPNNVG